MAYDTEDMVRNIGQIQANAMFNLYPGAGGGAMFEPGAGMSSPSSMLNPDLGPFGQAFSSMLQPDLSLNRDSAGMTAMGDLQSLKGKVEQEANLYDATKRRLQQEAFNKANAAQAAKAAGNPSTAPSSTTGGGVPTGSTGGAFNFPFADMVKGYIPDDLKEDPELMKIIATGAKAESGWNPRAVNPNGGATGLWQFHPKGMGAGATQDQLMDPQWQAQRIVPQYAEAYRRRAQSGQSDPSQVAAWVAGQVERPEGYNTPGSPAWNNYANSYGQVGQTAQNPAPANSGAPYQVNRTSQFGLGLNGAEAEAFCGPAAAMALAGYYGNNIPLEQVRQAARQAGWTQSLGMAGVQSEVNLLGKLGVNAQSGAWNDAQAQQLIQGGTPVIIDSPAHYFVADAYDPKRGYRVGTSGTDLTQGAAWLTPQQMQQIYIHGLSAGPRSMIWRS